MTKLRSIGDRLWANVEALLRDEQPHPIDEMTLEAAKHDDEVRRVIAERDEAIRAERRARQAIEMKDPATGKFPHRAVNAALASWPNETSAMRQAREHVLSRKRVIVFAGATGSGKTSAAAWIALEDGGSSPGFIRTATLERRGRYSKGLDEWLESRSMLVIDDAGGEYLDGKGCFNSLFEEVIDMFYGAEKRLALTTNLLQRRKSPEDQPQFTERYGDRVASRLAEIGQWASCGARDLRRDQLKLATGGKP